MAKITEKTGFSALYLTGAGVSYTTLGMPDVGLVTMSEMVAKAESVCVSENIPVVADGDNGFGNALNVICTVQACERVGAAGIQNDDQVFPKRCVHSSGKELIRAEEMIGKIWAAVEDIFLL